MERIKENSKRLNIYEIALQTSFFYVVELNVSL